MSRNDWWNKYVYSFRQKSAREADDWIFCIRHCVHNFFLFLLFIIISSICYVALHVCVYCIYCCGEFIVGRCKGLIADSSARWALRHSGVVERGCACRRRVDRHPRVCCDDVSSDDDFDAILTRPMTTWPLSPPPPPQTRASWSRCVYCRDVSATGVTTMPLRRGLGANVDAGRFHEPGIHHGSYTPGRNYPPVFLLLIAVRVVLCSWNSSATLNSNNKAIIGRYLWLCKRGTNAVSFRNTFTAG